MEWELGYYIAAIDLIVSSRIIGNTIPQFDVGPSAEQCFQFEEVFQYSETVEPRDIESPRLSGYRLIHPARNTSSTLLLDCVISRRYNTMCFNLSSNFTKAMLCVNTVTASGTPSLNQGSQHNSLHRTEPASSPVPSPKLPIHSQTQSNTPICFLP